MVDFTLQKHNQLLTCLMLFFAVDPVENHLPVSTAVFGGSPGLPHFIGFRVVAVLHAELNLLPLLLGLPTHSHQVARALPSEVVGIAALVYPGLVPRGIRRLVGIEASTLPAVGAGPVFFYYAAVEYGAYVVVANNGISFRMVNRPFAYPEVKTAVLWRLARSKLGSEGKVSPAQKECE